MHFLFLSTVVPEELRCSSASLSFLAGEWLVGCAFAPADVRELKMRKEQQLAGALLELCACYMLLPLSSSSFRTATLSQFAVHCSVGAARKFACFTMTFAQRLLDLSLATAHVREVQIVHCSRLCLLMISGYSMTREFLQQQVSRWFPYMCRRDASTSYREPLATSPWFFQLAKQGELHSTNPLHGHNESS